MPTFSLSPSARTEIRALLLNSQLQDPVVRFLERAEVEDLFDELSADVLRGVKSTDELAQLGETRFQAVQHHLVSRLEVVAVERSGYSAGQLLDVDGMSFVLSGPLVSLLAEYQLTFEAGQFSFRGADGISHTLRSLAMSKAKFGETP